MIKKFLEKRSIKKEFRKNLESDYFEHVELKAALIKYITKLNLSDSAPGVDHDEYWQGYNLAIDHVRDELTDILYANTKIA